MKTLHAKVKSGKRVSEKTKQKVRQSSHRWPFGAASILEPGQGGCVICQGSQAVPPVNEPAFQVELSNGDPDFDEDGDEFVDVDVTELAVRTNPVDVRFTILWVVAITLGEAAVPEILYRKTPHVIELGAPAAKTVEGGVRLGDDGGDAIDDETNGPVPHAVVEIVGEGVVETLKLGEDVGWQKDAFVAPPVPGPSACCFCQISQDVLKAEGEEDPHRSHEGSMANETSDPSQGSWFGALPFRTVLVNE